MHVCTHTPQEFDKYLYMNQQSLLHREMIIDNFVKKINKKMQKETNIPLMISFALKGPPSEHEHCL